MIIHFDKGGMQRRSMQRLLMGLRLSAVTLEKDDWYELHQMDPGTRAEWIGYMATKFPPQTLLNERYEDMNRPDKHKCTGEGSHGKHWWTSRAGSTITTCQFCHETWDESYVHIHTDLKHSPITTPKPNWLPKAVAIGLLIATIIILAGCSPLIQGCPTSYGTGSTVYGEPDSTGAPADVICTPNTLGTAMICRSI